MGKKVAPIYYGWIIVGVSFVTLCVCFGLWYSFSVFLVALVQDCGWSQASTAGVFSAFVMVYSAAAVGIGTLLDRYGARVVMSCGALLVVAGLLAASTAKTFFGFFLSYGILTAIGACAIGHIAQAIVISHWFFRNRGLALGIALSGISVGTMVLVPCVQAVVSRAGWRDAYLLLAGLMLILVFPMNLLFQRKGPGNEHRHPHENERSRLERESNDRSTISAKDASRQELFPRFKETLKTSSFWTFFAVMYFTACVTQGTLVHQVAYVVNRGFSAEKGALVIGIVGIMGSFSKTFFGYLCDRIGSKKVFTIINACAFLGLACMACLRADLGILLYGYGVLFGIGYGAMPAVLAVKAANLFHGADFGKIYGLLYTTLGLGGATGSWVGGKIFDLTGGYTAAIFMTFPLLVLTTYLFRHIGSGSRRAV